MAPLVYGYRPLDRGTYPLDAAERAPTYLKTWLDAFPTAVPARRDFEDWAENAAILDSARKLAVDVTVLPEGDGGVLVSGAGWLTPKAQPGAPLGAMLGFWSNRDFITGLPIALDPIGTDERAVRTAGNYARSATFLRHAGRALALTGGDVEGEAGIEAGLRATVNACGHGQLFLKTVVKGFARRFDVDPSKALWPQLCAQDDADECSGVGLSWIPVQHEGAQADVLLVQEAFEPRYEYRVFIVDGKPVTSAGCIEAFTPLQNAETFDCQMEEVRSNGVVVTEPALRDRYIAFAETFCREFAAEHGEGLDYSLDLAVDGRDGAIVCQELNPPLNLGRYASSLDAWLSAIVKRTNEVALRRQAA